MSTMRPNRACRLMAASRNCDTSQDVRKAFRYAFENIKPTDMVDVRMFQKYKNQVAENAAFVREILEA